MTSVELVLLGGFQALAAGQPVDVPGRKERALLAFLAMPPGEPRTRDRLCGLLWSERGDKQAHDSLKQAILRLRRSFDPTHPLPVLADRASLVFDRTAVAVDVQDFERLLKEGTPEAIARAAALYRGDLLDGLDVRDPAFEEWLTIERQRLRDLAREAMGTLVAHHLTNGNHDQAAAAARRLLGLDPLREPAHRALMQIYAEQGQAALALRQYEICRDALQSELGVAPEAETERLYRSIKEKRAMARRTPDRAPASPALADRPKQDMPALAVKPFENVSPEPEWANLAYGITNGILVALTCTPGLTLIQDESASLVKSSQLTVPELARRFDVRYVLKGSVCKFGDKFRVSAELVDMVSGQYLWAEQFDRDLQDIGELFAVQDEITQQIVTALDVKLLTGEVARLLRKSLRNRVALENFYRAEDLLWCATTKLEFREVERLLEEVICLEPTASVGYAAAGLAYWSEAKSGLSDAPAHAVERAIELCRKAVTLNDVTGYPHLVMAQVHLSRREYDEAEAAASRAVLARPSCPNAFALMAGILTYLGRPAEAIEFAQHAVRLTPVVPPMYPAILASAYYGCERHEQAIAAAKAAIELDDQSVDPYLILAASSVVLDRAEEARWAAGRVLNLKPGFKLADYTTSQPYKELNQLGRLLDQLRSAGLA